MSDLSTRIQLQVAKNPAWIAVSRFFSVHLIDLIEYGCIIAVWYIIFGRIWNADFIPVGNEYARSMSPFFFWDNLKECISCSFWFPHGGGKPYLADPFGSFLHPASMVLSLLFGAVLGASYTESFAFLLMGASALWLGRMLGLLRIVRIWFAIASMIGGHMVCRLEIGTIGLPLSMASMFFAAVTIYYYFEAPSDRRAILVGVAMGALLNAGQMYYQYFFVLVIAIALGFGWKSGLLRRQKKLFGNGVLAGIIALMFATPIFLNMALNLDVYSKLSEPGTEFSIPIQTQILNFIISQQAVYRTDLLNPSAAGPYAYATYIGMLPVVAALAWFPRITVASHRRLALIALAVGGFAMIMATGIFTSVAFSIGVPLISYIAGSFRFIVLVNGVSSVAILLIAALGTDGFLRTSGGNTSLIDRGIDWIQQKQNINVRSAIVLICIIVNLLGLNDNKSQYVNAVPIFDEPRNNMVMEMQKHNDGLFEIPDWLFLDLIQKKLKASQYWSSVMLNGRDFPPAQYIVQQQVYDGIPTTILKDFGGDWKLVKNDAPDQQYASLISGGDKYSLCSSAGMGGHVTVTCDSETGGTIRVFVNAIQGWEYSLNGQNYVSHPVGKWLTVEVPAGHNTVTFRYEPWYAWVGFLMIPIAWIVVFTLLGITSWSSRMQGKRDDQELQDLPTV